MSDVKSKVIRVIQEQLDVDEVTPELNLDDLGADSLARAELVAAIEAEFHTDIPDDDAEKFLKVSDIIEYVRKIFG